MSAAFVDEVVIPCAGGETARHRRENGPDTLVFDPLHYLMLIEAKPNALYQAAPLQGWNLREALQHLRHLLEAHMGNLFWRSVRCRPSPRSR